MFFLAWWDVLEAALNQYVVKARLGPHHWKSMQTESLCSSPATFCVGGICSMQINGKTQQLWHGSNSGIGVKETGRWKQCFEPSVLFGSAGLSQDCIRAEKGHIGSLQKEKSLNCEISVVYAVIVLQSLPSWDDEEQRGECWKLHRWSQCPSARARWDWVRRQNLQLLLQGGGRKIWLRAWQFLCKKRKKMSEKWVIFIYFCVSIFTLSIQCSQGASLWQQGRVECWLQCLTKTWKCGSCSQSSVVSFIVTRVSNTFCSFCVADCVAHTAVRVLFAEQLDLWWE